MEVDARDIRYFFFQSKGKQVPFGYFLNEDDKLELIDFTENNNSNICNTKLIIEKDKDKLLKFFFIGQVNSPNKYAKINVKANININYVSF